MIDWSSNGNGNKTFWFVTSKKDGRPGIMKPDGTITWSSPQKYNLDPSWDERKKEAYIRENLFIEEYGIWDITVFSLDMVTPVVLKKSGKYYVFITPSRADDLIYPYLSEDDIELCQKHVDRFYGDPNIQAGWPSLILYPVVVEATTDGFLSPVYIGDLGNCEDVIEKVEYGWERFEEGKLRVDF